MIKIIIATTTCSKFLHKIERIKESWFVKRENIKHIFFTGHSNKKIDNLIALDCKDTYDFLTQKTRKMFEYVIEKEDFDYLIKTNDDSFVNIDKFLSSDYYNFDYGGYICEKSVMFDNTISTFSFDKDSISCNAEFLNKKSKFIYGTGGFYYLSKDAINCCLQSNGPIKLKDFDNYSCEDLIVGAILQNNFKNLKINNMNHIPKVDLPYDITNDGLSVHPVHHTLMSDLEKNKNNFSNIKTILKYKSYLSDYLKK